jgi:hypothetical protein
MAMLLFCLSSWQKRQYSDSNQFSLLNTKATHRVTTVYLSRSVAVGAQAQ